MTFIGPTVRFAPTHGRSKLISSEAGAQDLRETKYPGAKISSTTIVYKVVSTNMIHYLTKLEVGTGTVNKSVSLAASINVLGTTKYWLAQFARPGFGLISSGRDLEIIGLATFSHKFDLPLLTAWTSKPTLASDPGEATTPTWRFSDGGNNPVTWDADNLDCESIRLMFDRMPITRTSAGGTDLQINRCGGRRIRFRLTIGNDSTARNLVEDYENGTPKDLVWALNTGESNSTLTLEDCILDPIAEEFLTAEENPEVQLNLSGEAKSADDWVL